MFTELLPLLEKRNITITLAHLGNGIIRANVIPMRLKDEGDDAVALTTALGLEGTAEELDARSATEIQGFVASTLQTSSTLEEVKAAHQAALKTINTENKKELAARKNRGGTPAAAPAAGAAQDTGSTAAPPAPAAPSLPLFDTPRS